MTANRQRGEIPVEYSGKTYVARPSFTAISAIEDSCGAIGSVFQEILRGDISIKKTAYILFHSFRAGMGPANAPNLEKVGDMVTDLGLEGSIQALRDIFTVIVQGPSKAAENSETDDPKN